VKRKPDALLVLLAVFGFGVVLTLVMPMTSNDTVAAPASALQAGVIVSD
jgi:acyl-coenzyme A synthetase/AMP-(fatty) acid ligase